MAVVQIDHVQLAMPAGGEGAAILFYEGLLGVAQVAKPPHLAVRGGCWFEDGDVKIHLGVEEGFAAARKAHPALRVTGLGDLVRRLREHDVSIRDDEPLEGYDRVYVEDPFGNRIELLEPRPVSSEGPDGRRSAHGEAELDWLATNRALWDEMAALHPATELYDVQGLIDGRDDLRPWEDAELGPIAGMDVVHLQCHIGTDTIGLARRGATVVGVDFSPAAIRIASELATACGLTMGWVETDVYDAARALAGRTFDVVYTGIGALGWLPDLGRWAEVVRALLRPGGVLYLVELHPMWVALIEDGRSICQHAIDAPFQRWDEEDRSSYAAPGVLLQQTAGFERLHAISDVLSAVLAAGMEIELFHELDVTPAPTPWLEQGANGLYRFPEGAMRFPLTYSLRARRA